MSRRIVMQIFLALAVTAIGFLAGAVVALAGPVQPLGPSAGPSAGLSTGLSTAAATAARSAPLQPSATERGHIQCIEATRRAERENRIAPHLLGAISLTETGRWSGRHKASLAWPWTVMAEGKGRYLPSKQAAVAEVKALQARGISNIDVGCMQVNLHYHGEAFDSVEEAFDPAANAGYAAAFLRELKDKGGQWSLAVARYHSWDEERGEGYRKKVFDLWFGQRSHLVASAEGATPARHPSVVASEERTEQMAEERERRRGQMRMILAARAANQRFLEMQRAVQEARHKAEFEARKAKVMAEWEETKRKRAAAKAGRSG